MAEQNSYTAHLLLDGKVKIAWPEGAPTPQVGDQVAGKPDGQHFVANVTGRAWTIGVDTTTVALVITAETPQPARRGSATVERLPF